MHESFDVFEFVDFLHARWKFVGVACGVATLAALATALLLPRHYTSTATILIDPPAAGDPRVATALSTVYLESLKTYELLAANDQLFLRAAEHFHLLNSGTSVESLKRRVLKVDKLRDTRALQISVTLPDPRTAQAMAQFISEGAVELSRSGGKEADETRVQDAANAAEIAKARLADAARASLDASKIHSAEALRSQVSEDTDLKSRIEGQLLDESAELAVLESANKDDAVAARARVALLQKRVGDLSRRIDQESRELAQQSGREDELQATLKATRTAYEAAMQRLADLRLSLGTRSEWLRLVDPGIVPERPSSPHLPLIVIGAALLALFASLLYLTVCFTFLRARTRYDRPLRYATHGDD